MVSVVIILWSLKSLLSFDGTTSVGLFVDRSLEYYEPRHSVKRAQHYLSDPNKSSFSIVGVEEKILDKKSRKINSHFTRLTSDVWLSIRSSYSY